jgi:putative mRNA 3-end processing factor
MVVQRLKNGLQVTGTPLFLDATRRTPLAFVSHAHSDHIARHERTIATAATLRFMAHRLGELTAPLPVPYHRPFALGSVTLELLPAGHILGSAQLRVTRLDGHRLVYTGDLNLSGSLTAEPAQVAHCDTLVIESTYGHPRYAFPPREEVLAQLLAWVQRCLCEGDIPVVLGYALGKAQEAMKFLASHGLPMAVHPAIHEMATLYAELGVPIEGVRRFEGTVHKGEVLLYPPHQARAPVLRRLWPRRTAILTGWAMEEGGRKLQGADVAFPLSDHADYRALIRYAKATGAREVITHHGHAEALAQGLREAGVSARALGKPLQLSLL